MRTCGRFEKLLWLFGEGELSERQDRRLAAHLRRCAPCRNILEEIRDTDRRMKSIRQQVPVLSRREALTHGIMEGLNDREEMRTRPGEIRMHPVRFSGRLQLAGTALLLILLGTFIFQETSMWIRLDRLETRMARKDRGFSGDYIRGKLISAAQFLEELPLSRMMTFHRRGREYVILDKETLFELIEQYGILLSGRENISGRRLSALLEDMGPMTWNDGLDAGELKTIYQNRDKLLARIQSERRTGGERYVQKRIF